MRFIDQTRNAHITILLAYTIVDLYTIVYTSTDYCKYLRNCKSVWTKAYDLHARTEVRCAACQRPPEVPHVPSLSGTAARARPRARAGGRRPFCAHMSPLRHHQTPKPSRAEHCQCLRFRLICRLHQIQQVILYSCVSHERTHHKRTLYNKFIRAVLCKFSVACFSRIPIYSIME